MSSDRPRNFRTLLVFGLAIFAAGLMTSALAGEAAPAATTDAAMTATSAEPPAPRMSVYYLAMLYRGPKWTADETPEVKRIFEGHMANIERLFKAGKLVVAGPFEDEGDLRGLFLLRVASKQEAEELCKSDPAIQAGRLRAELHRWWGPDSIRVDEQPVKH